MVVKSMDSVSIRLLGRLALISTFSRTGSLSSPTAWRHTNGVMFYSNIKKTKQKGIQSSCSVGTQPHHQPLPSFSQSIIKFVLSTLLAFSQIYHLTSEMFLSVSFLFSSSFRSMPTIPTARVLPACESTKDEKKNY